MAQDEFYNPYQFIPVGETGNPDAPWPLGEGPPKADDFRQAREAFTGSRFSHASYATGKDIWHGRIICRLSLKDPVFIGADRYREKLPDGKDKDGNLKTKDGYAVIKPYMLGGEPAIPASSLRGLISSLAEAASGSALRVLHNKRPVSYRQPMEKSLSALGMLKGVEKGELKLLPLCAPNIDKVSKDDEDYVNKTKIDCAFDDSVYKYYFAHRGHLHQQAWAKVFAQHLTLKAYIGTYHEQAGYDKHGKPKVKQRGRKKDYAQTRLVKSQAKFAETVLVDGANVNADHPPLTPHHMQVWSGESLRDLVRAGRAVRCVSVGPMIVAQQALDVTQRQKRRQPYKRDLTGRIRSRRACGFKPGLIRVLGVENRDMAQTKVHELFIPIREAWEPSDLLPIKQEAVETFQALAREVAENVKDDVRRERNDVRRLRIARPYLPFRPLDEMKADRKAPAPEKSGVWEPKLRDGQIVYFDIEEENGKPVVSAISFSSIWRDLVIKDREGAEPDAHIAGTWDFFRDGKKGEFLPFNSKRDTISPAEWMFGFVSEDGAGEQADEEKAAQHVAYAGRVRISAARLAETPGSADDVFLGGDYTSQSPQDTEHSTCSRPRLVRLKTLAEPKPPSPAMYFQPKNGQPIAKHALNTDHRPNGRKVYLHRDLNGGDLQPWKTEHPDENERLKNAVRPLDPQACHEHGDFWFHVDFDNLSEAELDLLCFALHPSDEFRHKLGMGKPIGLGKVHIEPVALFCIDRAARYGNGADVFAQARYAEAWLKGDHLPDRLYSSEAAAAQTTLKSCVERAKKHAERLEKRYPDAHRAIMLTGDPDKLKAGVPVHYPLRRDQNDPEQETFKWFVQNTKTDPQCLDPIKADQPGLYPLKRN